MSHGSFDHAVDRELDALQQGWPSSIDLRWTPRSTFDSLVWQFLPAFPEVGRDDAEALGRFCRLFAGSILLQDRLLDGDFRDREVGIASMRIVAMQHDAYRALHALYRHDAPFWDRFRDHLGAYARAFVEEDSFRHGRSRAEFTEATGLSLAIAKHGVAKVIVAALVESSGRDHLIEPLCASIDGVAVAFQMHDDLEDWRLDLWTRTPSILLSRLPEAVWDGPVDGDWPRFHDRVARHVYRGGHAEHVLRLALAALTGAVPTGTPAIPWQGVIAGLRARCERMLGTLATLPPRASNPASRVEAP